MICDLVGELTFTPLFGDKMVLIIGNKKPIKKYGLSPIFSQSQKKNSRNILKFIKKRYSQNLSAGNFKVPMDMINFIVKKEKENMNAKL